MCCSLNYFVIRSSRRHCPLYKGSKSCLFCLWAHGCYCFAWFCCHGSKCWFYHYLNTAKTRTQLLTLILLLARPLLLLPAGQICIMVFGFILCFLLCRPIHVGRSENGRSSLPKHEEVTPQSCQDKRLCRVVLIESSKYRLDCNLIPSMHQFISVCSTAFYSS